MAPEENDILKVRVMELQPRSVQPVLQLTGSVVSQEIARIHPEISGIVQKVHVREGDQVEPGTVLAELDPVEFRLNVEIAKAEAERARVEYERTLRGYRPEDIEAVKARYRNMQALYNLEEANLERNSNLFESGVMTEKEWSDFQQRLAAQRAMVDNVSAEFNKMLAGYEVFDVRSASASYVLANARQALAQRDLEHCFLKSPISGVVTTRQVEVGQLVNLPNELFILQNPEKVWLLAEVGEKNAGRVETGQVARIWADALADVGQGTVARVGRALGMTTKSMQVWLEWSPDQQVPPIGAYARASIDVAAQEQSLVLRREWVHLEGGEHFVWLHVENQLERRPVVIGDDRGDEVTIASGISQGDMLVVSPPSRFRPGLEVETEVYIPPVGTPQGISPQDPLSITAAKPQTY